MNLLVLWTCLKSAGATVLQWFSICAFVCSYVLVVLHNWAALHPAFFTRNTASCTTVVVRFETLFISAMKDA